MHNLWPGAIRENKVGAAILKRHKGTRTEAWHRVCVWGGVVVSTAVQDQPQGGTV